MSSPAVWTGLNSSSPSSAKRAVRLDSRLIERPWGGEVWFTAHPELPLLVKFIYTREVLSVQVHPTDDYAQAHHGCRGKTEMWHFVSAAPDARLALGFRQPVTLEHLREATLSGEILDLLNWVHPRPGDTFFAPAGTVHAIGAGVELWEIQQNCDITYRLYDYNRGRELHLDHGLNVTAREAFDAAPVSLPVRSNYFVTDRLDVDGMREYRGDASRFHLLILMSGSGTFNGEKYSAREVWLLPPGVGALRIESEGASRFLTVIQGSEAR